MFKFLKRKIKKFEDQLENELDQSINEELENKVEDESFQTEEIPIQQEEKIKPDQIEIPEKQPSSSHWLRRTSV